MKSLIIISLILLTVSASFNYEKCAKEAFMFGQSTKAFYLATKDGNFQVKDISTQIENLIQAGQNIMNDCPIPENSVNKIQTVATGNCVTDVKDLANLCEKAVADYEAKNLIALVGDAEAIVKQSKVTLSDCKNESIDKPSLQQQQMLTEQCKNNVISFGMDLQHFNQVATDDKQITPAVIESTKALYKGGMMMIDQCGYTINNDGTVTMGVSAACLRDIANLAQDVKKAITDYDAKNLIALIKDAETIIVQANQTLADCTTNNFNDQIEIALINNPKINYEKCAKDAYQFIMACKKFVDDADNSTFNLPVVLADIQNIVTDAQKLIVDCGSNSTNSFSEQFIQFDASKLDVQDSVECQKDIETTLLFAKQAIQDYESKKIPSLLQNAAMIIKTVEQSLKYNCQSKLLDGIDIALINNPKINYEKCAVDAYHFGQACYTFVQDLENGTDSHNLPHIITDVQNIVSTAQKVVTDCGINGTVADAFVQYDVMSLDVENTVTCLKDIEALAVDVKQAISDFDAKNMIALVKDAEKIIVQANKTINDCTGQNKFYEKIDIALSNNFGINYEKCAVDAYHFGQACYTFVQDLENGTDSHNLPHLLTDIQNIVTNAQKVVTDCGINGTIADMFVQYNPEQITVDNTITCLKDIEALAVDVKQAISDFEAKNMIALVKDAEKIIVQANKTINDCTSENKFQEKIDIALQNNFGINYEKCAVDAYHFGQACYTFVQDLENGTDSHNLPHIITDVQNIVSTAQKVVTDCGINSTLTDALLQVDLTKMIEAENTIQCLKDLEQLAVDVKQDIADFEAKNLIQLVKDAEKTIVQANKTLNDCQAEEKTFFQKNKKAQLTYSIPVDFNIESCFEHANQYAAQFYIFYIQLAQYDPANSDSQAEFQKTIEQINTMAQSLLDQCGIQYTIPVQVAPTAGSCVADVIALAGLAVKGFKDLQTKQTQAFIVDLVGIISEASKAITDCFAGMEVKNELEGVIFACIHSMDTFTTMIEKFEMDYKQGDDFQVIAQDSSNLAEYVPVLLNTCGAGKLASLYTKYLPDSCIESLTQTADAGDKIYEVRNNFFDILRALPDLANALESDIHTCPLLERH